VIGRGGRGGQRRRASSSGSHGLSEHDNLRAALQTYQDYQSADAELRLAGYLLLETGRLLLPSTQVQRELTGFRGKLSKLLNVLFGAEPTLHDDRCTPWGWRTASPRAVRWQRAPSVMRVSGPPDAIRRDVGQAVTVWMFRGGRALVGAGRIPGRVASLC
jgi:hypothetical protein